jgi:ABC-type sugar transport system permease subunit
MESDLRVQELSTKQMARLNGRSLRRMWDIGQAYLYLLPAFLILGVFSYAPSVLVFFMSLFKWNFLVHGDQPFIGLGNYQFLLHDSNFWQSLQVTLLYLIISVPLQLFLSLSLAIILMGGIRAKSFWRLVIFAPFITPMVATTIIWSWMFDYYHGFLNAMLTMVNLHPIDWLNDPHWVLVSIIWYTTWKSLGFSVVLFMAGLTNISPTLSEAARVDGANPWHIFRYITWPLILPITLVVILLGTIDAFKMFQPVFLLTGAGGGPANAARTLGLYLFSEAFGTDTRAGRGSAIAVIIFLLVFTIAAAQLGLSRRGTESLD